MRKWIVVPSIVALLFAGNTAMAKKVDVNQSSTNSLEVQAEVCGKIPPGLLNALKKVKNPKAKASIQKNVDKHMLKCEDAEHAKTDEQIVSAVKAALQVKYSGTDSAQSVTSPLQLSTTGTKGTTIAWSSNKPNVISNNGLTVVRPASVDEVVVLTATITLNEVSVTKSFTVTVKAASTSLTDIQKVAADKAALEIKFTGTDTINHVTAALAALPSTGTNGSTVFWLSGNPAVISNDGKTVVRPAAGDGDAVVLMIAIIASNDSSDTKVFHLTVKQQLTDTQKVAADKTALDINFGGSDTLNRVTRPVDQLAATGENGSLITWISSFPAVVSHDGKTIVRPAVDTADVTVVMTALITSNGITDTKSFTLTVKKEFTTLEKLASDKSDLAITYGTADSATKVTKSLTLPTSLYYGSTVVWASNNTAVIANNGTLVSRPAVGTGDVTVTLTAYISNNGIADSRSFQVIVKQLP